MNNPEKLAMRTPSLADEKFAALAALFPNAVTETIDENGLVVRAIDKDVLAQEINAHVVEGREERYQFTWPDKRKSILLANAPIAAALRPVYSNEPAQVKDKDGNVIVEYTRSGSLDFDKTENLYIEGDNLDVLKLLHETYLNRVKMIYIDPPYNTGNDFIYEDDFAENNNKFLRRDGQYDEQGNRLTPNLDSNGRFHTDWLNMIYPRLLVARDLLTEDGVIFISIDDNEVHNMRKICDEVLGESNFVACIVWERAFSPVNLKRHFSVSHDYVICYAKMFNNLVCNGLPRSEEADSRYSNQDNDARGNWASADLSVGPAVESNVYTITTPSGRKVLPPNGYSWRLSRARFAEFLSDNRIWFGDDGNGVPRIKRFLSEVKQGITPMTIWKYQEVGHSQKASQDLKRLFDDKSVFTYPKPVELVKRLLELYTNSNSIILDFFSGSATTAHAVMQLNAEDGGHRKFIMVQLQEPCDEKSEAFKAGYKNICEIGKERIRRAGKKIKEEAGLTAQGLDTGFRVLKLDSSNMKDVYYTPEEFLTMAQKQQNLFDFMDNIKEDRSDEDLLFQVMLDLGIPLSAKITQNGDVFSVNDNYLIACFKQVDTDLITEIAKKKPYYAVFRDSSFLNDSVMVNFEQVFATYSPNTIRRVL